MYKFYKQRHCIFLTFFFIKIMSFGDQWDIDMKCHMKAHNPNFSQYYVNLFGGQSLKISHLVWCGSPVSLVVYGWWHKASPFPCTYLRILKHILPPKSCFRAVCIPPCHLQKTICFALKEKKTVFNLKVCFLKTSSPLTNICICKTRNWDLENCRRPSNIPTRPQGSLVFLYFSMPAWSLIYGLFRWVAKLIWRSWLHSMQDCKAVFFSREG